MKKIAFSMYVLFEWICSAVGFAVIIMLIYAILSPNACVNFKSQLFGDYKKEACDNKIKGE